MKLVRKGFCYYLLATLLLAVLFFCYVLGDNVAAQLDAYGWAFFVTSCVGHAALVMMAVWMLCFLPWALLRWRRVAACLLVGGTSLLCMLTFVNMQVYKIYRFHINGFIVNMLTGPNAGDIFDFDAKLLLTETLLLLAIAGLCIALWWVAGRLVNGRFGRHVGWWALLLGASLVVANVLHVYGSFVVKPSVMQATRLVPYYFPLSASSLLQKLGVKRDVQTIGGAANGKGDMRYPLEPLLTDTAQATRPNIVMVLIDSWSKQALTSECMPHTWTLAHEEQWYQNHVSCSNGTRYGVFGLFTGLPPYYYSAFEAARLSPLLVDQLLALGYDFRAYPSATLRNPPFHRLLFQHVPRLRTSTEGATAYERDLRIKEDFIRDLPQLKSGDRPFFAFLFFDLLHAYSLPRELLTRFQPSWEYGDFARLNNDMDPTPFWNLYRNSAYQTDLMVHQLTEALRQQGLYDSTLVIITGDHSQEYNENHKNYWGHNSNFSQYQIGVPLIVHQPTPCEPRRYTHRTTHYDLVPTLMHDYLGVTNTADDYSAGRLLNDSTPRLWHFVGNELRYAFLVEGDTIITKEGNGWLEVTDAHLNPVRDYHVRPRDFDQAIKTLNRFFK